MPDTPSERNDCADKLLVIATLLRSVVTGITAGGLVEVRKNNPNAFGTPVYPKDQLSPTESSTWRKVLWNNNNRDRAGPDVVGKRLELVLRNCSIFDLDGLTTPTPVDAGTWADRFEEILQLLLWHRKGDLAFIGSPENAVKQFGRMGSVATTVFNTVFARTGSGNQLVRNFVREFEATQRRILRSNTCEWIDIVLVSEMDYYNEYIGSFDAEERRKLTCEVLYTSLPLIQCLVYKDKEGQGAAFVGWSFPGLPNWRVYFSDEKQTVDYFFNYGHQLQLKARQRSWIPSFLRSWLGA
jgi:hypothetical protein